MNFLHFNMEQLRAEVARVTEQELAAAKALIRSSCDHMEASEKSLDNSARVYVALKNYLTEHHVDCLAAACWRISRMNSKSSPASSIPCSAAN